MEEVFAFLQKFQKGSGGKCVFVQTWEYNTDTGNQFQQNKNTKA